MIDDKRVLRPYQQQAVHQLSRTEKSLLLADEPGLGKTIQIASLLNITHPEKTLIVCPASLRLNWARELDKWCPFLPLLSVRIISFENLRSVGLEHFNLVVIDEAHYLKNPKAQRTKYALGAKATKTTPPVRGLQADRFIFLTGTPIVNRPMDAYPLLNKIAPDVFGSRTDFGKRFCAGKLKQVSWHPVRYAWDFSGASRLDELNDLLRQTGMIRRTKQDVLTELPAKIRQVVEIPEKSCESKNLREAFARYESLSEYTEEAAEAKTVMFELLSAERLAIGLQKVPYVAEYVLSLVEEVGQVVVFAHHREVIESLAQAFLKAEVKPVVLYGGMSDADKQRAVDAFQSGKAQVFVGQHQSAGTGITLTAAQNAVFAELPWTPGDLTQCEDRLHRIGQTQSVNIIHIVLEGSVDARMCQILVEKQTVVSQAVR